MKLIRNFLFARAYNKAHKFALEKAIKNITDVELLTQSIVHANKDKAFPLYTSVLDLGDEAMKECRHYVDALKKNETFSAGVKIDMINLAKVYETLYKKLTFIGLALSVVGGFQPLRAKEMLDIEVKYPEVNTSK